MSLCGQKSMYVVHSLIPSPDRSWLCKARGSIEINPKGTIFNRSVQGLAYADDLVVLGRSVRVVEEALMQLKLRSQNTGLSINEEKIKYMRISRMESNLASEINLDGQRFEIVDHFKIWVLCLGLLLKMK